MFEIWYKQNKYLNLLLFCGCTRFLDGIVTCVVVEFGVWEQTLFSGLLKLFKLPTLTILYGISLLILLLATFKELLLLSSLDMTWVSLVSLYSI